MDVSQFNEPSTCLVGCVKRISVVRISKPINAYNPFGMIFNSEFEANNENGEKKIPYTTKI